MFVKKGIHNPKGRQFDPAPRYQSALLYFNHLQHSCRLQQRRRSETELQRKLNQSRVVAGRNYATEVAGVTGNLTSARIDRR